MKNTFEECFRTYSEDISKPAIMQVNDSYFIIDPNNQLYKEYSSKLKRNGYKIRCINLASVKDGNKYDPTIYINTENDEINLNNLKQTDTALFLIPSKEDIDVNLFALILLNQFYCKYELREIMINSPVAQYLRACPYT